MYVGMRLINTAHGECFCHEWTYKVSINEYMVCMFLIKKCIRIKTLKKKTTFYYIFLLLCGFKNTLYMYLVYTLNTKCIINWQHLYCMHGSKSSGEPMVLKEGIPIVLNPTYKYKLGFWISVQTPGFFKDGAPFFRDVNHGLLTFTH